MKVIRFAATLFAAILLVLMLFPPWSEHPLYRRLPYQLDPVSSSLGHHWRFTLPYHWGWREDTCMTSNGDFVGCNGKSVWEPNRYAVVDLRMLEYESILALLFSVFVALIIDPVKRTLTRPTSALKDLISKFTNRKQN